MSREGSRNSVHPEDQRRASYMGVGGLSSVHMDSSFTEPVTEPVIHEECSQTSLTKSDEPQRLGNQLRNARSTYPSMAAIEVKEKIGTMLDTILQPTLTNKACYRVFRSNEGISNERNRQRKDNRWIIHPFSPFRWYWDLVMVMTLMLTLLSLPIEIAFYTFREECTADQSQHATWIVIHTLADAVFLLDIILNFRTGYIHAATEEVILNNKLIIIQYIKSWFIVDLISSVPFDYLYQLMFLEASSVTDCSQSLMNITLKVLRLTKLLSLLRILRVARLLRYIHKMEEFLEIESKVISMFNLVMVIAMFSHWNGCVQFLTSYVEHYPSFPTASWISQDNLTNSTTWDRYSRSLFRSMSHMLCIGYGLFPPRLIGETWAVMCSMTLGATFYALFIAHMSGLIMTMDSSGKKYEEKISEVKQYMRFRRVPVEIQQKVFDYYDHKYQRKYFDEGSILHEPNMSGPIKREIQLHNCKNLVQKVPFLSSASTEFLYDIICKLTFQVFFRGDEIVQAGRRGDCMYFLEHGRVEIVLPTGQLVNTLTDGSYFGEISLLLEDRRTASVLAVETCDVYQLRKADFDEVLEDHPTMKVILEKIAIQRLEDLRKGAALVTTFSSNQTLTDSYTQANLEDVPEEEDEPNPTFDMTVVDVK